MHLSDESSIYDRAEKIMILQKVKEAKLQSKDGKRFTESQARTLVKKWSK